MKIIDQQGKAHFTHEVEFSGKVVKCTPDSDCRSREELGRYESMQRAAEVMAEIYSARSFGKREFQMPER